LVGFEDGLTLEFIGVGNHPGRAEHDVECPVLGLLDGRATALAINGLP
jgi:hypothetical protein